MEDVLSGSPSVCLPITHTDTYTDTDYTQQSIASAMFQQAAVWLQMWSWAVHLQE
jgi:hypothetical protein